MNENAFSRLEAFEKMLRSVQEHYKITTEKMQKLKAQGKEKSAAYRQFMGNKLQYQNMLSLYKLHGLIEEEDL